MVYQQSTKKGLYVFLNNKVLRQFMATLSDDSPEDGGKDFLDAFEDVTAQIIDVALKNNNIDKSLISHLATLENDAELSEQVSRLNFFAVSHTL